MNLKYVRLSTPRPTYEVLIDGERMGLAMMTRGRQWVAATTARPVISVEACSSRHEAVMALIGKLTELGEL